MFARLRGLTKGGSEVKPLPSSTKTVLEQVSDSPEQVANKALLERIQQLKVSPVTQFPLLLNEAEVKLLEADTSKETVELLAQYKNALSEINGQDYSFPILPTKLTQNNPYITLEFKVQGKNQYRHFEFSDFENWVGSCSKENKMADLCLPESRFTLIIDNNTLRQSDDKCKLQQGELMIYKGFHPSVIQRLNANIKPSMLALRGILKDKQNKPQSVASMPSNEKAPAKTATLGH